MVEIEGGFVKLVVSSLDELKQRNQELDRKLDNLKEKQAQGREELSGKISGVRDEIHSLAIDFAKLRTAFDIKSGIWGLIGSLIGALLVYLSK